VWNQASLSFSHAVICWQIWNASRYVSAPLGWKLLFVQHRWVRYLIHIHSNSSKNRNRFDLTHLSYGYLNTWSLAMLHSSRLLCPSAQLQWDWEPMGSTITRYNPLSVVSSRLNMCSAAGNPSCSAFIDPLAFAISRLQVDLTAYICTRWRHDAGWWWLQFACWSSSKCAKHTWKVVENSGSGL
jgi:hypothetical protein